MRRRGSFLLVSCGAHGGLLGARARERACPRLQPLRRAAACVATYRVAQPLHGRDADGAVKGAWPNRQAVAQVCQAHVAFNLALCRHLQHGGADVHALQAAAGRRCSVHLQSACSSACCAVLPLPPRCTTPPPLQRAHHPGVPVVAKRLSTEAGAAPQVEQEPRGAVAGQRQQLERSLREGRLDGYHASVIRVLTRFIVIIKYLRWSCMLWPVALAHGSLVLFEYGITYACSALVQGALGFSRRALGEARRCCIACHDGGGHSLDGAAAGACAELPCWGQPCQLGTARPPPPPARSGRGHDPS